MKRTSIVAVALTSAGTIVFSLWRTASMLKDPDAAPAAIALALAVASPMLPLLVVAVAARSRWESGVALAGTFASAALAFAVYLDGLVLHPRPVNALLLFVVPVVQWGIGLVALAVFLVLRLARRPRGQGSPT